MLQQRKQLNELFILMLLDCCISLLEEIKAGRTSSSADTQPSEFNKKKKEKMVHIEESD